MHTLLISIFLLWTSQTLALSANEIIAKADANRMPQGDLSFVTTIQDFKGKQLDKETKYKVLSKGVTHSLVETIFPERMKGRKLLMVNNSLWFYTPDIKRPTRISMQQKLTGEVANGDIARTNFSGDYDATLSGEETINNTTALKLKLSAKNKEVTYSQVELWVSKEKYIPLKASFYAVSGKLLKVGEYGDLKTVLGKQCVTSLTIKDSFDPKRSSKLIYSQHKREKIDESQFNKDALAD